MAPISKATIGGVRGAAWPLTGASADYDGLLERIGDARFVLLGEASHGPHELLPRARGDYQAAHFGKRVSMQLPSKATGRMRIASIATFAA